MFIVTGTMGMALLGQAAGGAEPASPLEIQSVWDFVVRGGPTIIAIGVCSLVALTVIVERAILLRRSRICPPSFLAGAKAAAHDPGRVMQLCLTEGSPAAELVGAIMHQKKKGAGMEAAKNAAREAGSRILVNLRRRMRMLSALPQVSTMLGLLGTIFGMIKTFQAVATSGNSLGKTEVLAKGIFEAWTNTAAGLLVAIPVLVAYQILMGRIDGVAVELDQVAVEWLEQDGPATAPQTARMELVSPTVMPSPVQSAIAPMPVASVALAAGT